MASMLDTLPQPARTYVRPGPPPEALSTKSVAVYAAPPYGRRKDFKPTHVEDFGDGGAFPEIAMDQFPLDMGRPGKSRATGSTLAVTVSGDGSANYDAIVKQGANRSKIVHTGFNSLVPKIDTLHEVVTHPAPDVVAATAEATMAALQLKVDAKLKAAQPKSLAAGTKQSGPQYIKYTPSQQSRQHNSGADHRIIQMQDMVVDPLEPPKFRHKKVPRGPGSPPVPVLHSPPRPVSKDDQVNWKIPPAVSAWKNPKGYTIPLDKRLAADGRGMQEMTINKKHMGLAQALYAAEETARSETELAARLQREMKEREKAKKEEQLRKLAAAARMGGGAAPSLASRLYQEPDADGEGALPPPPPRPSGLSGPPAEPSSRHHRDDRDATRPHEGRDDLPPPPPRHSGGEGALSREELEEKAKRDELREDRKRERERERRLEAKNAAGAKRSKITRDRERDVSEKMALGMANVRGGDVQYDSRLFGQDQGMQSGFTGDDAYNVYDKALFADRSTVSMYRPRDAIDSEVYGGAADGGKAADVRTDRFKADKGFTGTDGGRATRTGPVQFEKEQEADPFGLDSFIGAIGK